MPPDYLPSAVNLDGSFPPLLATFKKTESEIAAAYIIRTLQLSGDAWRPVAFPEIAARLRADVEAKNEPWAALAHNPFARPDVHRLIEDGFAEWYEGVVGGSAQFTEKGFEALRKWVRSRR